MFHTLRRLFNKAHPITKKHIIIDYKDIEYKKIMYRESKGNLPQELYEGMQ